MGSEREKKIYNILKRHKHARRNEVVQCLKDQNEKRSRSVWGELTILKLKKLFLP